jgi:hypothetical protein
MKPTLCSFCTTIKRRHCLKIKYAKRFVMTQVEFGIYVCGLFLQLGTAFVAVRNDGDYSIAVEINKLEFLEEVSFRKSKLTDEQKNQLKRVFAGKIKFG